MSGKAVFDVAVDQRPNRPAFGKSVHVEFRMDQANGFLTLEDASETDCEITPTYRPEASEGTFWNDPQLFFANALPWRQRVRSERLWCSDLR
jgi:dTDP-4-dehydrorhamnose 3,5-epimerase-like enzyme